MQPLGGADGGVIVAESKCQLDEPAVQCNIGGILEQQFIDRVKLGPGTVFRLK